MFKQVTSGRLRFSLKPADGAREVFIAGDFTHWNPVRMRKQAGGRFVACFQVAPGMHEYKFLLAQQWVADPDNSESAVNPYGTMNSVVVV
jgi:1,4-alpha-glucan branching enzyme